MSRRFTYAASLSFGGDEPTAELEAEVDFTVDWGSPESGRSGPPEDYDPGSPSTVEDIRVLKIDGRSEPFEKATVDAIVAVLEDGLHDEMIQAATDQIEAGRPE